MERQTVHACSRAGTPRFVNWLSMSLAPQGRAWQRLPGPPFAERNPHSTERIPRARASRGRATACRQEPTRLTDNMFIRAGMTPAELLSIITERQEAAYEAPQANPNKRSHDPAARGSSRLPVRNRSEVSMDFSSHEPSNQKHVPRDPGHDRAMPIGSGGCPWGHHASARLGRTPAS